MSSGNEKKIKVKGIKTEIKKISKASKHQQEESSDSMQNLLNMSQFESALKKKIVQKPIKSKDIQIDLENDSQDEIIKKLVLTVQSLKEELSEYKIYADGTFCTSSVHNRVTDDLDKRVTDLRTQIEDMP